MLQVHRSGHTGFHAALCLLENGTVLDEIILSKTYQLAIAQDIVIGARSLKRDRFRSVKKFEKPHHARVVKPLDFVTGRETVVKQLRKGQ